MKFSCLLPRTCSVLALSMLTMLSHAQTAEDDTAHAAMLKQHAAAREQERQEIAKERSEIEARKLQAEKACWQRFAVENCLSKVRAQARKEDSVLRERELHINSEERQEKARERLRSIDQKQREKQVPAPVNVTPRDGSGPLSTETQAERATEAQKRAAEQVRRVQSHEASVTSKQEEQAQARAKAVQAQKEKQQAAEARRASKADEITKRKGAPLPIPQDLPKP